MAKRRRTNSLSGGTGDINPQFYSGTILQTGNDTVDSLNYILPTPRFSAGQGKAIVIEILKVWSTMDFQPPLVVAISTYNSFFALSTKDHGIVTMSNLATPDVFYFTKETLIGAFTAAEAVVYNMDDLHFADLTDGSGHGVLIATDSFYAQIRTVNSGVPNTVHWKILYRFKKVGLSEYIGIVQSQQ